jgi:hypothetical protein
LNGTVNSFGYINTYLHNNPDVDQDKVVEAINNLFNLTKKQIGLIDLAGDLDIETVTEIFIRINQKGVVLSNADFVMSKIASYEQHGGNKMRKMVDYFCRLLVDKGFIKHIQDNDTVFTQSDYFKEIKWMATGADDLYVPDYIDMLRVAFTFKFSRGKFSDLVALLSGRNFETRSYEGSIAEASYAKLSEGLSAFVNQTNYQRFIMIIKSTGLIIKKLYNKKI